ncbi:MAG: vWA domain-containing protein, partial [Anaerolineales bacterium]
MPFKGSFVPNLVRFINLLRQIGLPVGSSHLLVWIEAMTHIDWRDPELFYHTAESVLVSRQQDLALFRRAFQAFWWDRGPAYVLERPAGSPEADQEVEGTHPLAPDDAPLQLEERHAGADHVADLAALRYSAKERLSEKDFAELSEEERSAVETMLAEFKIKLPTHRTRRFKHGEGTRVDLRRSLRENIRHGGEWLHWARQQRKRKRRPLVILADISGSMMAYSRLILLFTYAMSQSYQPGVEAFLFGTRLTRITPAFRHRVSREVLAEMAALAPDWSGGTRIGQSLRSFNMKWARRVLSRQAIVLIVSDGWDRGDPDLLRTQMARLQRS